MFSFVMALMCLLLAFVTWGDHWVLTAILLLGFVFESILGIYRDRRKAKSIHEEKT